MGTRQQLQKIRVTGLVLLLSELFAAIAHVFWLAAGAGIAAAVLIALFLGRWL